MSPDSKTRYLDITCMYNESIIYANIYISSNELLASDSHDWLLNCVTSSQNGFCSVARVTQVRGDCTVPEYLLTYAQRDLNLTVCQVIVLRPLISFLLFDVELFWVYSDGSLWQWRDIVTTQARSHLFHDILSLYDICRQTNRQK